MIKSIDSSSVHRITSGQVIVDLQTAVKELVENSLDASATTIDVKFKDYGIKGIEVVDNGSGISPEDYEHVAVKHHTSKLKTFEDLTSVSTFGFRGEALSSLTALAEQVKVITATSKETPMGTILEFDKSGRLISSSGKVARQRGTTIIIEGLFKPLPVRRKEFERNSKREFGKALNLLNAYALVPCVKENRGVRLSVVNISDNGKKSNQLRTDGTTSVRNSVSSLWGPKQLESLVELDLALEVPQEKSALKKVGTSESLPPIEVTVRGLISKFALGQGRNSTDRQFFFVNGRPCTPSKIQKAFNEVYHTFNVNQHPFIIADFILPGDNFDVNVSPDKRSIFLHNENNLVGKLKEVLEETFAERRSTFAVQSTQKQSSILQHTRSTTSSQAPSISSSSSAAAADDGFGTAPLLSADMDEDDNLYVQSKPAADSGPVHMDPGPSSSSSSEAVGRRPSQPESQELPTNTRVSTPANLSQESQTAATPDSSRLQSREAAASPEPLFLQEEEHIGSPPPELPTRPPSPQAGQSQSNAPGPRKSVQMVLSTRHASWSLSKSMSPVPTQPKKRSISDSAPPVAGGSRKRLRSQLSSFASFGSQLVHADSSEEEDQLEEEAEEPFNVNDTQAEDESQENALEVEMTDDIEVASEPTGPGSNRDSPIPVDDDDADALPKPDILPARSSSPASVSSLDGMQQGSSVSQQGDEEEAPSSEAPPVRPEIIKTLDGNGDVMYRFNVDRLSTLWQASKDRCQEGQETQVDKSAANVDAAAGINNDQDADGAERELSRIIHKGDFASMEVIGQFNLGFIIARRRVSRQGLGPRDASPSSSPPQETQLLMDDLFIVDQHAADEKYNFETLQETTKIESQRLFRPQPLELSAADQAIAIENLDILQRNGFEIAVNDNDGEDDSVEEISDEHEFGRRLTLVAQPVSGKMTFDMQDLEEIIELLREDGMASKNREYNEHQKPKKMVRCSKARAMFASRACRKSVMIGMALNASQMTSVVRHMGTMHQPWNCPHGRPTMRHLVNLLDIGEPSTRGKELRGGTSSGKKSRQIDWLNI